MNFPSTSPTLHLARHSCRQVLQSQQVTVFASLLIALTVIAAGLGWVATDIVQQIYQQIVQTNLSVGATTPALPTSDIPPLAQLRNLPIYIVLMGSLVGIVLGHQLIATDRSAGILPLLGSRPISRRDYILAKLLAVGVLVTLLTSLLTIIEILAYLSLPAGHLGGDVLLRIFSFAALTELYLLAFAWLGLGFSAIARTEAGGIIFPMTLWLGLTFLLPALTTNLTPTAALNPIAALAAVPDSWFFQGMQWLLGPFSLAMNFQIVSATLLHYLPPEHPQTTMVWPLVSVLFSTGLALTISVMGMQRINWTQGGHYA